MTRGVAVSRVRSITLLAVVLGLLLAPGPSGVPAVDSASAAVKPSAVRSADSSTLAARIMIATQARKRPGFGQPVRTVLATRSQWSRGPQHLLVLRRVLVAGVPWLKLRLPSRPNNSSAWVPASRTRLMVNRWLVRISVKQRSVTVLRNGRRVLKFKAVVGARSTPTPRGRFAIYERVRQPDPSAFLGPFALHLTAHSNVLDNYGGGPGRVAIHGRGAESLLDPLGTARSHGCIRVSNGRIVFLASKLPLGTPVVIR